MTVDVFRSLFVQAGFERRFCCEREEAQYTVPQLKPTVYRPTSPRWHPCPMLPACC